MDPIYSTNPSKTYHSKSHLPTPSCQKNNVHICNLAVPVPVEDHKCIRRALSQRLQSCESLNLLWWIHDSWLFSAKTTRLPVKLCLIHSINSESCFIDIAILHFLSEQTQLLIWLLKRFKSFQLTRELKSSSQIKALSRRCHSHRPDWQLPNHHEKCQGSFWKRVVVFHLGVAGRHDLRTENQQNMSESLQLWDNHPFFCWLSLLVSSMLGRHIISR